MPRLVKRYGNRKLYDTSESRYVTLDEIGRWVKAGEDVRILEDDRRKSGLLPLRVLRELIQHGEQALQGLAATVDRGMEAIRTAPERAGRRVQELVQLDQLNQRLAEVQHRLDEVIRRGVELVTSHPAFQAEMRRIERTVRALEARIGRLRGSNGSRTPDRS